MARVEALPRDQWPLEMLEALKALRPSEARHSFPKRENRPQAPGAMETFALHPDLARAFFTFNGHVLSNTTLAARQRHLVVLRVAARRKAAFLWAQHFFQARDAGLTDEEIARIAFGPDAPFLEPLDAALLRAVDELVDDGAIREPTWDVLASELDPKQLLDVIFTAGCYETVAWFMRSLDLEVDPADARFLEKG
jgi:alkylhydroperoxidase family enzyme